MAQTTLGLVALLLLAGLGLHVLGAAPAAPAGSPSYLQAANGASYAVNAPAATTRYVVTQVPLRPVAGQSARVWMYSDTAFGETARLEYCLNGTTASCARVDGSYNDTTVAGANWYADIPAQAANQAVYYQLLTRNESGSDYGYSGFNWFYNVGMGVNGGFESGNITGWTTVLGTNSMNTTTVHNGTYSVAINTSTSSASDYGIKGGGACGSGGKRIVVSPNTTYAATVWVYIPGTESQYSRVYMRLQWFNSSSCTTGTALSTVDSYGTSPVPPAGAWVPLSIVATSPASAGHAEISLFARPAGSASRTVYFDDFSFTRVATCGLDSPYQVEQATGNLASGGTDVGSHTDDGVTPITLPFPVYVYGQQMTGVWASSNGVVQFGSSYATPTSGCSPFTSMNYALSPLGANLRTDLAPGSSATVGIFTQAQGTRPNRVFYITYHACLSAENPNGCTAATHNFEVRLYEDRDQVDFVYGSNTGSGFNIFTQRGNGPDTSYTHASYGCNVAPPANGTKLTFRPLSCDQPTSTPTPTNTSTPTTTPSPTADACRQYGQSTSTGGVIVPGTTDVGNHGDNVVTNVALPFSYTFYGQPYNNVNVSSNGNLQFATGDTGAIPDCLPQTALGPAIFPEWWDLTTDCTGCGIFTVTTGNAPQRVFNLDFRVGVPGNTVPSSRFEVRLYEGQQRADIVYGAQDVFGRNVVGVQKGDGIYFTQHHCDTSGFQAGTVLTYSVPGTGCSWTPTPTPTQTDTATPTDTTTPTRTSTPTNTATDTATNTQTSTFTTTPTWTQTQTPTQTPTETYTPTATNTPTATVTDTATATDTSTSTATLTSTRTETSTATHTPSHTPTQTATGTPTRTSTQTATSTSTNTVTSTATDTSTSTATSTNTSTATASYTPTQTPTETASVTSTPTYTPMATETNTPTATATHTGSPTSTDTATLTATDTATNTATATDTATATNTATATDTDTATATITNTNTATQTPTNTPTVSSTSTQTATATATDTATSTDTATAIPTDTWTYTATGTATATPTWSPTASPTDTNTLTATITDTSTSTPTPPLTATYTATASHTPTQTATNTDTTTPTGTATLTATATFTSTPTCTMTGTVTETPTATYTSSATVSYTATAAPTGTPTATATTTGTATNTSTSTPVHTFTTTATTEALTATPTRTGTASSTVSVIEELTATPTDGVVPTVTPLACGVEFLDVEAGSPFYGYVQCLRCRQIAGGYSDGNFRPSSAISRGQIAKLVSTAAGFSEDPGGQLYQDVPPGHTYYNYINRLTRRGLVAGYPCPQRPGGECAPEDATVFRPYAPATRGQLAKIVSNAAGFSDVPGGQFYADVPPGAQFYEWITRLTSRGVMSGYPCGTQDNEPCDGERRPYFRPNAEVTRGQAAKITANTFFPECQGP